MQISDFCRYYQQPTNNTPELALRIGYMQQNLPHLLLSAHGSLLRAAAAVSQISGYDCLKQYILRCFLR